MNVNFYMEVVNLKVKPKETFSGELTKGYKIDLKKKKRPDGRFIPNITSIDFEQELLTLSELKHVATVADIEEMTGFVIDISGYFLND